MDLMAADRQHINSYPFRMQDDFAESLNRIHMKQCVRITFLDNRCCVCNRLNGTDLIIHTHHRYLLGLGR